MLYMNKDESLPIIDAHSHVQFPAYDSDRDEVLRRAKEAGVKMIAVGTQASTSEAGIALSRKNPGNIWAAVGFHPSHLSEDWHHDKNEQPDAEAEKFGADLLQKLAEDETVVAIGECGLDYFRLESEDSQKMKAMQKEVFLAQANIAQDLNKPLMIHCRPSKGTDDAYEDLFSIISDSKFTIPKIIHFYVGSLAMTKKFVLAGFYFTFGGVVTFARDYDESIKYIPAERILLETDCPYVAPKSQRGKRNEPSFIAETGRMIAEIKGMESERFFTQVYENSKNVFKI